MHGKINYASKCPRETPVRNTTEVTNSHTQPLLLAFIIDISPYVLVMSIVTIFITSMHDTHLGMYNTPHERCLIHTHLRTKKL